MASDRLTGSPSATAIATGIGRRGRAWSSCASLDRGVKFAVGRGSVLGPLLATVLFTALPEFAAPLVAWSTFLYAALLLVIVIALPGGSPTCSISAGAANCRKIA